MFISVGGSTVGYMGVLEGDFNFLSRWAAAPWSRWDKDCSHFSPFGKASVGQVPNFWI